MARRKPIADNAVVVDDGLTTKQRLFIDHYLVCLNATEAARLAGYEGSDNVLAGAGFDNLRKPKIRVEIERRLNEHAMTAYEVIAHLTAIARGDIADVVDDFGALDMKKAKARGRTGIVKGFRTKTTVTENAEIHETEVILYDRLDALKTLAKFHSLLVDRVKIDDWRSQAIELIKADQIEFTALESEFGHEVAKDLFLDAGKPIHAA